MTSQVLIEAAGHLRELRRSWGYDTAASFARTALRVRNGVSAEKAIAAYRQEFTAAMWKREERQAQEGKP